jgi:hypothetical protein
VVATAVAVHLGMRSESALGFAERDWVVIGDLVNMNADQSFDITLASAFRIGIEESRYVNVVPKRGPTGVGAHATRSENAGRS